MTETTQKKSAEKLSYQEKIQKLKEKESQLKAQRQKMESRAAEEKRKKENRVKFLLGAFFLDGITKEQEKFSTLFDEFKNYLTRERDQDIVKTYFENVKTERAIT